MAKNLMMILVAAALPGTACHRFYDVRGDVVINPRAVPASEMPALLCTGRGGAPEVAGMYARPLTDEHSRGVALVLCRDPNTVVRVPFKEGLYYGSLPREMHIYAFREAAPDTQPICETQPGKSVIQVSASEWTGYRRCFDRHTPTKDMAFAVTFDDAKARTWTENKGTWTEQRDITLR
jgi:hypothetical protein